MGVADILHKWLVHRALAPALLSTEPRYHLITRSDHADRLLADLALHELDLVLTDTPVGLGGDASMASTSLGASSVVLVGTPALLQAHGADFPRSLDDAPLLLPGQGTSLRRALERWMERRGVRPRVVAEFEDSALMKAFARDGAGLMAVPASVVEEVEQVYGVRALATLDGIEEPMVAVTRARSHPALAALLDRARRALGGS